ncbi:MAG: Rieske 2Fe-2S domain-containing protein [Caulobacteraceae bacterium]
MFTEQDNEDLTRVGPGTLMGDLMRRFWMPVLLPEELPTPDCAPVRVRVLGENLIAFKDTNGRLGLLDRYCPHRLVDLWFGRNEECGLRCVYHGWKFDVDGNVLDMPAEPANSPLRSEVKTKSYPIVEWGGMIWAYLGDKAHMPPVPPELEWGLVPPAHRHIGKRLQENNWAQGVEGGIDSSHVGILHSLLDPAKVGMSFAERQKAIGGVSYMAKDRAPRFFVRPTDYGLRIGARRIATDEEYYWRITQFLLPFYTMIARGGDGPIAGHAWTPIDDHNTWTFTMHWNPVAPLGDISEYDANGGERAGPPGWVLRPAQQPPEQLRHRPRQPAASQLQRHPGHRPAGFGDPGDHGLDRQSLPRDAGIERHRDRRLSPAVAGSGAPPSRDRRTGAAAGAAPLPRPLGRHRPAARSGLRGRRQGTDGGRLAARCATAPVGRHPAAAWRGAGGLDVRREATWRNS